MYQKVPSAIKTSLTDASLQWITFNLMHKTKKNILKFSSADEVKPLADVTASSSCISSDLLENIQINDNKFDSDTQSATFICIAD